MQIRRSLYDMFSLYCEEAQTPGQFRTDLRRIISQGGQMAGWVGGWVERGGGCMFHITTCSARSSFACSALNCPHCNRGRLLFFPDVTTLAWIFAAAAAAAKGRIKDVDASRVVETDIVDSSGGWQRCCNGCSGTLTDAWLLLAPPVRAGCGKNIAFD
jgi:hypothetical protein